MTDKQQNELLEKFINDSPLAEHILVGVSEHHKSFKPKFSDSRAYYEDANLLSSILMGAENFCWWLRRNNYKVIKCKSPKK